ncbi:unnamed protein product [Gongylonema pulchrum]|uniref:Hexosyltransferase n=1 Tax=Gongylonema pulchrum TaxID=637853 RepID=A0A183DV59_9BILA|nr:unnamed protein product [Gongylonema pulchrum]
MNAVIRQTYGIIRIFYRFTRIRRIIFSYIASLFIVVLLWILVGTAPATTTGTVSFRCDDHYEEELFDPYKYQWTIVDSDFCTRKYPELFLLIIVHTDTEHFTERMAVREMWGSPELYHKVGTAPATTTGTVSFRCDNHYEEELFDPYKYQWTIVDSDFCTRKYPELFLLIIVHTDTEHFTERMAVREMWGNPELFHNVRFQPTKVIFAVGKSNNSDTNYFLEKEAEQYGDLLQQDFMDTYENLTLKAVMWIRFVHEFCPKVPYILKMDDDVMINYFGLVQILQNRSHPNSKIPFRSKTMACIVRKNYPAVRENTKWKVPKEEYSDDFYPPFCNGWYYLWTGDLIKLVLRTLPYCTYYRMDDVHITGHMAKRVQAHFENWEPIKFDMNSPDNVYGYEQAI